MESKVLLVEVKNIKNDIEKLDGKISSLNSSNYDNAIKLHEYIASDLIRSSIMEETLKELSITLSKNTDSLAEHMKRTELNEKSIGYLTSISEKIDNRLNQLEIDKISRQAQFSFVKKMAGIITIIGTIIGIYIAISGLIN
jgi:hypothetical protein